MKQRFECRRGERMAKQIEGAAERIMTAAKREFLDKGYVDASLRTIAAEADTSTNSIYVRFGDKEGLFSAIVEPVLSEMIERFIRIQERFHHMSPVEQAVQRPKYADGGTSKLIGYMYEHLDEFRLLLDSSYGTRFHKVPQNRMTALVGPSGSGKSTLAKLIAGFWDVKNGTITMGGHDLKEIPLGELYEQAAFVSQDNYLFDDTVRENIRMGRRDATDAEVEQAARDCGCYDFIMGLENGFDTVVGCGGGHLSGGEKQRISIARAMLKNAPIVILDEATAYTDPENEAIIQESVARLVRGKALIVIAHRLLHHHGRGQYYRDEGWAY